ncbi:MAG: DUF4124 domain-containing protein [Casimicrobiaceae bacterium]
MKSRFSRQLVSTVSGLTALALLAGVGGALAQSVVKCVDAAGNITYQDSACTGGQAGRAIALPKAESRDDAAAWEAAARDAKVVAGMPKRWVLQARGAPIEIRPGKATDNATEVWRYGTREGVTLIGFAGSNVAWQREEALPAAIGAVGAKASGEPTTRGPQNRRFVIRGRYCEHVFAEIGSADRQETLPATGTGIRYVYEPQPGDPQMRTSFSCIGGKVADVERILVK